MTQQRTPLYPADASAGTSQMHKAGSIPLRIFAICLTSVVVAVHYTNYGPLIPTLINDLHISSGQTGLFSTFLFSGLAVMYIPAGTLAHRYGPRSVLIGSSVLPVFGAVLLPLSPNLSLISDYRVCLRHQT